MDEIIEKIKSLKKSRNAVILAHNYQLPEVQDIADFVGDSLGLSIQASKTKAEVIIFCGVYFMAETAKILSPDKIVVIPDKQAGCPMADMITAPELSALKAQHPRSKVLCYVNTTAEVKALCDICCTSGNALEIVKKNFTSDDEIIFVPDKYLADYVSKQTGIKFIVWQGFCPTHARMLPEEIAEARKAHPGAEVVCHPECPPEIIRLSDKALSTEGMFRYIKTSNASEFIIATEIGILHRLSKSNPDKKFYPISERAVCPNMKKITLEKVMWSLESLQPEVNVPPDIIQKARKCIFKMLEQV